MQKRGHAYLRQADRITTSKQPIEPHRSPRFTRRCGSTGSRTGPYLEDRVGADEPGSRPAGRFARPSNRNDGSPDYCCPALEFGRLTHSRKRCGRFRDRTGQAYSAGREPLQSFFGVQHLLKSVLPPESHADICGINAKPQE